MNAKSLLVGFGPLGRRAVRKLSALSAALAVASTAVHAQSDDYARELGTWSLSDLMTVEIDSVYGASRYVQKSSRAPSSLSHSRPARSCRCDRPGGTG